MASVLDTTFTEFKEWIMPLFAQTFSPKSTTFLYPTAYQIFGDRMLDEYDYTEKCEQFLITQTKFYIRTCLDRSQSHNVSTDFLEKLLNKIAAYFSYYIMNKYPIPESGKSKNKLRIRVQAELKKALFDDNEYIILLKQKQAINREFRRSSKSERRKTIREHRRQDAMNAYRRAQEIRSMFNDAQDTPRKKR